MITNTTNKVIYTGDGTTTAFDVPFQFEAVSELKLFLHTPESQTDTEITGNWSYDYNTHKLTYPTTGAALPNTQQLVILRRTPQTQEKDHEVRLFTSQDVEGMADKLTREIQDVQEQVSRAIKMPASHTGEVDSDAYISDLEGLVAQATQQAQIATTKAGEASASAVDANASKVAAGASETNASTSASNASTSETNAAGSASAAATDAQRAEDAWNNIANWLAVVQMLKDGDIHTYIAGTATTTYDGSLTVFPVENEFAAPISVFVNGQYKELATEYVEDKTNNLITFTTALNSGDRVNIVANITVAEATDFSHLITVAISTHNANPNAHSSAMGLKQDKSNLVTSVSSSSTDAQYPSAKLLHDQLSLKAATSYVNEVANAKLSKTGGAMSGDLVMDASGVDLETSAGDTYRLEAKRDQSDNVSFEIVDKSVGSGVILDAANANEPFYTDGVNTPVKLLNAADKAVANGVASLDANTKIPNAQIPAATAVALGGVILVYDPSTNTLDIRTTPVS